MNTKCLISTSIITLFTASVAQAADIIVPQESRPVVSPPAKMSKQVLPPVEMNPNSDAPPVISAPTFSWNGFYLGGQIGGFSGKTGISVYAKKETGTREWTPVEKDKLPQLSGFMGGLYAGANVDLGNSLVLGVDTDIVWSNKQDTKIVAKGQFEKPELPEKPGETEERELNERRERTINLKRVLSPQRIQHEDNHLPQQELYSSQTLMRESHSSRSSSQQHLSTTSGLGSNLRQKRSARNSSEELQRQQRSQPEVSDFPILRSDRESSPVRRRHVREVESVDEDELVGSIKKTDSNTLKQKWSGATRVRIGFAADRILPYIAGGIAYTQLQNTYSRSIEIFGREIRSSSVSDTKMMVGYTLGGGVDFAMVDNVILRAEYRYSNFGKQKFAKDKLEIDYQTNDFRVGVAYKF
ncbi:outer membrane protein [Bartonella bovis]|uniref:Hemin binding protein n=1 Tax=Bartonella bovis 91-4 TaxID=1094491 RepID=N6VMV4_9HYPH|nr:outer membrane protein [Bartonella bovis]ENN92382.1 hemin binding protein [Bartonella bovis 91-4]